MFTTRFVSLLVCGVAWCGCGQPFTSDASVVPTTDAANAALPEEQSMLTPDGAALIQDSSPDALPLRDASGEEQTVSDADLARDADASVSTLDAHVVDGSADAASPCPIAFHLCGGKCVSVFGVCDDAGGQ